MALGNLSIGVKIDKGSLKKATSELKSELDWAGNQIEKWLGNKLNKLVDFAVIDQIRQWFTGVAKWVLNLAGNLEQAKVAFGTMLGSGEKADKMLRDLSEFASKTPFELTGIRQTAKQLLAFGIESEKIIPTLKSLGDVSAGLSVPIEQVAYAYGQVRVAGRLLGGELRQFTNAGVPLIEELSKNLWVAQDKIRKMVEDGAISFSDVEKAFQSMSGEGGKFADLMTKQSATLQGSWSNLVDASAQLGEAFGSIFIPALTQLTQAITPMITSLKDWVAENPRLAGGIGIVVTAIVGLLSVVSALTVIWPALVGTITTLWAVFTVANLPILAFAWALAWLVAIYQTNTFGIKSLVKEAQGMSVEFQKGTEEFEKHKKEVDKLTKAQKELDEKYKAGKITKEQYTKQSEALQTRLKVEKNIVDNLGKQGYANLEVAQQWVKDAVDRLNKTRLDPSATISAIRAQAQEARNAIVAYIKLAQARAIAIQGEAGKVAMDTSFIWYLSRGWETGVDRANKLLDDAKKITDEAKQYQDLLTDIDKQISNPSRLPSSWGGGWGSATGKKAKEDKTALEALEHQLEKVKDKYEKMKDAEKDLEDKTKEYTKNMKQYYRDLEDGIKLTEKSIVSLQDKYKKDTNTDRADFLRWQATKSVGIGTEVTGLQEQLTRAQTSWDTNSYTEIQKLQEQITTKQKEQEEIKKNLVALWFTELELQKEIARATGTEASRDLDDFKTKQELKKKQYEDDLAKLETQKRIYEYFETTKFDTTLGLQKALKDDKLYAMDEENRQLFIKLAERQIALIQEKNEKIAMEQELAQVTTDLSNGVTAIQSKNVKILKAEYQDLIRVIQQAVVAQQSLNNARAGKWYAEGGYTWDWPRYGEAGTVHYGEYVLSQPMLAKLPWIIPALEAIRMGWGSYDNSRKITVGSLSVWSRSDADSLLDGLLWKL